MGNRFQRMEHKRHIRERPDTYLGTGMGFADDKIWIAMQNPDGTIVVKFCTVRLAMALISISKEVFDNATDNVQRSRTEGIDPGIIEVNMTHNTLSVKNYGKHIPTSIHPTEGIPTPQMIFGELLTSDNYDDSIQRYKIGRNGYGAKLTNIFSTAFQIRVADPISQILYTQLWENGMNKVNPPQIEQYMQPTGFTEITFMPDFACLYRDPTTDAIFSPYMQEYYRNRAMEMSYASQVVTYFQGQEIDCRDGLKYFHMHFNGGLDPETKIATYVSKDGENEMIVGDTPGESWIHAFVNGTSVNLGQHVNAYAKELFRKVIEEFDVKYKKKVSVNLVKKNISMLLRVKLVNPTFNGQIKEKLETPTPKVTMPAATLKSILEWKAVEALKKHFRVGLTKKKKIVGINQFWNPKYDAANMSKSNDPSQRLKCSLILTEGDTGKTLAEKGTKFLPGGKDYNGTFPLRGKLINCIKNSEERIEANREVTTIMKILNADPTVDYYKDPNAALNLRYGKVILLMDADDDGYHITGLFIAFVYKLLKSLLPLGFVTVAYTPVIEGFKRNQRITFLYINQYKEWAKKNDSKGWRFNYKKGLGSWNTDPETIQKLFQDPILLNFVPDEDTYEMMELAFGKECSNQRKEWISDFNESTPIALTQPRPISHFINNDFRAYSKAAVTRSIPKLMDGMKPSHRKVLYAAFLKFHSYNKDTKYMKMVQFAGFVMEKSGYHHGDSSLYGTIVHMGQRYLTGPNNIPLIEADGNYGERTLRGKDASPARYLHLKLSKLAYLIFPKEDFPLMNIMEEDGEKVEPEEMYPIIPMALINKVEGIGTGWSTNIQPHHPFHIIEWLKQWIEEKKNFKNYADYDNYEIDVSTKKVLVPWYRDWSGNLIRVRNQPYEVYRVEGKFHREGTTVVVTEIPVEMSLQQYKVWGEKMEELYLQEPQAAYFRSFTSHKQAPFVEYRLDGCGVPELSKLNLVSSMAMSNMILIDKEGRPKHYQYTYMIMCEWALERFKVYVRRKEHMMTVLAEEIRIKTLKYHFIEDIIEGRLVLARKKESEYIPYMIEKGYPCGKKNNANMNDNDDEDLMNEKDKSKGLDAKGINEDFRRMPVGMQTKKNIEKLKKDVQDAINAMEALKVTLPEDMWLRDLHKLQLAIEKEYSKPLW